MLEIAIMAIFVWMCVWFVIGTALKRNDVADIAWGLGFVVLAWVQFFNRPSIGLSLAVFLITIWGVRLSTHIFIRNRKKGEDSRYVAWRKQWGKWYIPIGFLQVYMLQGLLLLMVAAPVIALGQSGQDSLGFVQYLAVGIWVIGFIFEAVGDYQLKTFVSDPKNKGKIMQSGLWRYTRHPNYFGEVVQWWAIWLITFGTPWFIWALLGPITITVLILKVSGVPLLEKRYSGNVEFNTYKARTSMFVPLPPKKG